MRIKRIKTKKNRQESIKSLIERQDIETQGQLLALLGHQGIYVTQATLSRDLREMGITKTPKGLNKFIYRITLEEAPSTETVLRSKFMNFVREIKHAGNLIVIKTPPGEAQGVARVIDNAKFNEIMGTIAGDDTILVIVDSNVHTRKILAVFRQAATKT